MASVASCFIEEFTSSVSDFNFVEFLDSQFEYRSPDFHKHIVPILQRPAQIKNIAEVIFKNFFLNSSFKDLMKYSIGKSTLKPFFDLICVALNLSVESPKILSRLIFLLHLSKANLPERPIVTCLELVNTIEITEETQLLENQYGFSVVDFFIQLKGNKNFHSVEKQVYRYITNRDSEYDYSSALLVFFSASIAMGLNGFAGFNTVYVNIAELILFQKRLKTITCFNEEALQIILKINLLRLFLHEICHVSLRQQCQDLNASSPNIYEKSHLSENAPSTLEAGFLSEKLLFTGRIDWLNKNINLIECANFLYAFLDSEYFRFDAVKAGGLKVTKDCTYHSAIDLEVMEDFVFE